MREWRERQTACLMLALRLLERHFTSLLSAYEQHTLIHTLRTTYCLFGLSPGRLFENTAVSHVSRTELCVTHCTVVCCVHVDALDTHQSVTQSCRDEIVVLELEHELLYIKWVSTIESLWIWECLQLLLHSRLLSCDPREQLAALLPSYSRRAGEHHSRSTNSLSRIPI